MGLVSDVITIELNRTECTIINIALTALAVDLGVDRIEFAAVHSLQNRVRDGLIETCKEPGEVFFPPLTNMSFEV